MKNYIATFWRSNIQLAKGGYETKRPIEANNLKSAERKALNYEKHCIYGGMTLLKVEERKEDEA